MRKYHYEDYVEIKQRVRSPVELQSLVIPLGVNEEGTLESIDIAKNTLITGGSGCGRGDLLCSLVFVSLHYFRTLKLSCGCMIASSTLSIGSMNTMFRTLPATSLKSQKRLQQPLLTIWRMKLRKDLMSFFPADVILSKNTLLPQERD